MVIGTNYFRSIVNYLWKDVITVIIIIIIIIIHKTIFIVPSSMARSHMREFTLGPLSESQLAPGGRQLVRQAAKLTFDSTCRLLQTEHSPIMKYYYTQPWGWYSYTAAMRVEGWVDLDTSVNVQHVSKAAHRSDFRWKHRKLSAARFHAGTSRAIGNCDLLWTLVIKMLFYILLSVRIKTF